MYKTLSYGHFDFDDLLGLFSEINDSENKTTKEKLIQLNHNFIETDESYVIEIDAPGVKKQDIEIDLNNKKLTVNGERKCGDSEYIKKQSSFGKFKKVFVMPDNTDDEITAVMEDGVLTITVKKITKNKKISIT
jgi:HSP20 family molecular chaperone IbpA